MSKSNNDFAADNARSLNGSLHCRNTMIITLHKVYSFITYLPGHHNMLSKNGYLITS